MSPKRSNHIHKFRRMDMSNNKEKPYLVYHCINNCTSYFPISKTLGMVSICNRCNEPFLMGNVSITHAKPHCNECTKSRKRAEAAKLAEFLKGI